MLAIETINIILRIKASVHHKLCFTQAQNIKILQKMLNRLGIWYISCKLTVIKGDIGFFTEYEQKIKLRQLIFFLVFSILHLSKCSGIVRYTGTVICPVFFFNTTLSLQSEKLIHLFISNGCKKFAAARRDYINTVRMLMCEVPLFKTIQVIIILKYQVIGD